MNATMTAADLAGRLGLRHYRQSWRGDCPACGYKGTFSIRSGKEHRPLLYCASCMNRDALTGAVRRIAGDTWQPPERDVRNEAAARPRRQDAALRLWNGSVPVVGTLAERYLQGRGIGHVASSDALRFRPDTPHPEGGKLPALLALVHDVAGKPVAVHRTYLDPMTGWKTTRELAKASLGPIWAGAIRLHPVAHELVIAEGIETAASADLLMRLPAWAAISAGNMAKGLMLPPDVRSVIIAVDPDRAGEAAARAAWHRWTAEGRKVRLAMPDRAGCDFNDTLMARGQPEVAA